MWRNEYELEYFMRDRVNEALREADKRRLIRIARGAKRQDEESQAALATYGTMSGCRDSGTGLRATGFVCEAC